MLIFHFVEDLLCNVGCFSLLPSRGEIRAGMLQLFFVGLFQTAVGPVEF